jgi:hypothetical protein
MRPRRSGRRRRVGANEPPQGGNHRTHERAGFSRWESPQVDLTDPDDAVGLATKKRRSLCSNSVSPVCRDTDAKQEPYKFRFDVPFSQRPPFRDGQTVGHGWRPFILLTVGKTLVSAPRQGDWRRSRADCQKRHMRCSKPRYRLYRRRRAGPSGSRGRAPWRS